MRRVVGVLAIILSLAIAFFGINTLSTQGMLDFTGRASDGQVLFCINEPPQINLSNCPTSFNQSTSLIDNTAYCTITATDEDNETLNYTLTNSTWAQIHNETGNLTLRPLQDQVGATNLLITVTDTSGCGNAATQENLSLTIGDINDPPVLVSNVTDFSLAKGKSSAPYSLFTFFDDPDNDALNFTVLGQNKVTITITQATGLVYFTGVSCGSDYVLFRATDPEGLSAESEIVKVTSTCVTESESEGSSGGGRGGGSAYSCTNKWDCKKWTDCNPNSSRSKYCIDLNGCDDPFTRTFWEACEYIPTCFDGIQNQDETAVDCGGSCKPCGTCFDGILNNGEEAVDCGGKYCSACQDCTNGIMDWGETGIDCGGACGPCASCFDGVQNQDETGIDCGGSCPACAIQETPGILSDESPFTPFLLILAALLLAAAIIFKFYRKQTIQLLSRLALYFTRKKRKQILLNEKQKTVLLTALTEIKQSIKEMHQPASVLIDQLTTQARNYYGYVIKSQDTINKQDVETFVHKKISHDSFKQVLQSYYPLVERYEQNPTEKTYVDAELFLEELRLLVLVSSTISSDDLINEAIEKEVKGTPLERIQALTYNIYLALQFEEPLAAKKQYLTLVAAYEQVTEEQKTRLYPAMMRVYHEIKYVLSWL